MHFPPLPATKVHCGHCPDFVTAALTHSFYLFLFFSQGRDLEFFYFSHSHKSPGPCKVISQQSKAMEARPLEKKFPATSQNAARTTQTRRKKGKSSYVPASVPTSGTEPAKISVIFLLTGKL